MDNCTEVYEVLQDVKNGKDDKERPWREKKLRNLVLANSFKRLGEDNTYFENKAQRALSCGCSLGFVETQDGNLKLYAANFCQIRLCPMCSWRRTLKLFHQVSKVMDVAEEQYPNLVPVFLTLTVRSCYADELPETMDLIKDGWHRFVKHRSIESRFHGYFRAFEVNYDKDFRITLRRYKNAKDYYDQLGLKVGDKNPNYKKFNPHIHTILLVDKSYFPEGSKKYLYTSDFVRLWRLSCRLDYDPTCWIRKVKKNRGKRKQIAEVAKYTTKDSSILTKNKKETDWLVELFDNVLRRRRLIAFGGILHKIARELKMDKPGEGDLINIDEDKDTIREDIATLILTYDWNYKLSHYVKRRST